MKRYSLCTPKELKQNSYHLLVLTVLVFLLTRRLAQICKARVFQSRLVLKIGALACYVTV